MSLCVVVMAGGSGTRLWPLSRAARPKQFLPLVDEQTMLQATYSRLSDLPVDTSITICSEDHRFFVAEQLREIGHASTIILEPEGRNTAPAIALAALAAKDDPIMLVLAADHIIKNQKEFSDVVKSAVPIAVSGKLVTFGIVPNEPNIGYGYIKKGMKQGLGYVVESFVEKPIRETAEKYVKSGDYCWNSGMFLFKASRYLEELQQFRPDIYESCVASMSVVLKDRDFLRIDEEAFKSSPSESIDYAVMELTKDAVVVPLDAGWSDIGSWSSLWDSAEKDDAGNVLKGDIMVHESKNSYVRTDDKLVAVVGVDNLVVVVNKDVVMVASKDAVQDVKIISQRLKQKSRIEWEHHREVYRPWGKYDSLDNGPRYQVKRITVKPGGKLSVQKHHHRSEHWVVVSGSANVTKGEDTILLCENESIYLPVGVVHALENPGKINLELIEVQTGSYLGEDDIIRLSDVYGREGQ